MYLNTTGSLNTATGAHALYSNSGGGAGTATGVEALYSNTTGFDKFTSLILPVFGPPTVPVVCSHISPVFRSLTVPSPLSM